MRILAVILTLIFTSCESTTQTAIRENQASGHRLHSRARAKQRALHRHPGTMISDYEYEYYHENIEVPNLVFQLQEDVSLIYYGFFPVNRGDGEDLGYMINLWAFWKACTRDLP